MTRAWTIVMAAGLFACTKGGSESASTSTSTSTSAATTASTSLVASPAPPPTPVPSASSAPSAAPVASAVESGSAGAKAVASAGKPADGAKLVPASAHVNGRNFGLDVASAGCRAGSECAMTIHLAVAGDYHVNKEYPYKFVATPEPGVTFLAQDGTTFSRAAGDFREEGAKAGTMTVRFKPSAAGTARVQGTFKMSVCSDENCQIEQQPVSLAIPVS
ncbi:hypothetical protein AKJ09_06356 [Labilithrix luteola]|uniref:Uncharacterized protein n=1 Tax=Labilithrix luteola TaxID=1391654 RepID=A0A0K1Q1R7_9BACT|nr:hypothetical protein [Labilithrix luteola]AKU99692.1 hypothetical protein AKJ09_06356 [Labilithrix luteola]